jgi:hypothetical protein
VVRKIFVASIGVATVLAVASCGSSAKAAGASGLQNVSASASSTPIPAPTVTVTATATPAAAKPCANASLTVAASGDNDGAAGTIVQRFLITNTSSTSCTMEGHPTISPFGLMTQGTTKAEANLDIKVDPIPADFGDLGGPGVLRTVAHGGTAVFFLKWSQVPVNDVKCPGADGFEFQPPQGATGNYKSVDYKFTPCGTAMQVSNVLPASVGS